MLLAATAPAVLADPVVRWDFGVEESTKLIAHGGVHRDLPGPRPPEFPDFDPANLAVKFDGTGSHYSFAVADANSPFDFTTGDAITIEAWVNMVEIGKGENQYVVGKGRTGDPGFPKENQNWALRMREVEGTAHPSFLFMTPPVADGKDRHAHRWTTTAGFAPGSGWHQVAVSYRFGDPESVRGWIDGKAQPGQWDLGGATTEAPVVDADSVWVGSAMGGSATASFRGMLDAIAISREIVPDAAMKAHFRRNTAETAVQPVQAPAMLTVPPGKVLVTFQEGLGASDRWPDADETLPPETARWVTEEFLIPRLPLRYDDWGIRASWKGPVLLRAYAETNLTPGKHRFLLRTRGLSRLWINGERIAATKPQTGDSAGYQPVPPVPAAPAPGLRPVSFGDQEVFGEAEVPADGKCRIVLETLVGTKKARAEPGELCLAVADDATFRVVQPAGEAGPLSDAVWQECAARSEASLGRLDDETRHRAAASIDGYWQQRHEFARAWVQGHPAGELPAGEGNPIDRFVAAKLQRAVAASAGGLTAQGKQFHESVLPVLSDRCFRCHGEKEKGDLRLNSREAALQAGTSGHAAVIPSDAEGSELLKRITSQDEDERMPPKGEPLKPAETAAIAEWIRAGAPWPVAPVAAENLTDVPVVGDSAFLRRVYLDTVGVPPTEAEARTFLRAPDRAALVDRLLADPRFADHWISYWQDVLAENPGLLKPSLNNSGPFRWFLYEALRDGKALDRTIYELVMMRGSRDEGGSAGFGRAADNDAPLAAKGQVLGSAFLGMELQCARCHDAPFHSAKQRDLYSLAAMLDRKTVTVPKSSTVPAAFFEKKARESLITVTLKPGQPVAPEWPFARVCGFGEGDELSSLMRDPADTRERLAALLTAPQNQRVAQVIANRVWKRLLGTGIVEPAHDWEGHPPSDPDLLAWLGRELVAGDYDLRHLVRLVLTSQIYQREPAGHNALAGPAARFFPAPDRRRLTAEQVVDSLYSASGHPMETEELTFDSDSRQAADTMISLGRPHRAWMFAGLSNERDRPSLSLPRAQAVTDVLEAFGWTGTRQNPRTDRETDPNVLQPGVLANSLVTKWVTRLSTGSELSRMARDAASPEALVESVFLRFLTRLPTPAERSRFTAALTPGFDERLLIPPTAPAPLPPLNKISWSSHLRPEATEIKMEMERRARAGDPADPQFAAPWRETCEDFVWAIINSPEFVWMP